MKKILVPIDFSDVSENAVAFAIELAKKMRGEVTLYHSIYFNNFYDFQFGDYGAIATMTDEVKVDAEKRMQSFIDKLETDVKISYNITSDSLVSAIKGLVKDEGYDLVVVGTHGCSGLEEVFVGSNAERVVRHAPCPVISIPGSVNLSEIRKVLVPINLFELRAGFLTQIANLQSIFQCELEFIWVSQPEISPEREEELGKELFKVFKSYDLNNYSFFVINNINPEHGIFIEAKETKADMVAMATHARRGILHWLSGSMTEDTVNHLDVPVWTFKLDKSEEVIKL
jgi:nucleotide-binding universal stress UspA family protein